MRKIGNRKIQLDDQQLMKILSLFAKEPKNKLDLDKLFKFIQLVAILGAALWTVYVYATFSKKQQELSLLQQQISVKQQSIIAESEKKRIELTLKKLEFDNIIKEKEIEFSENFNINSESKISVKTTSELNEYTANFLLKVFNHSKNDVELSWILLQWYIGEPSMKDRQVSLVNPPPVLLTGASYKGPIKWTEVGGQGSVIVNSSYTFRPPYPQYEWIRGGHGTKIIRPGDHAYLSLEFVVNSDPRNWIGIAATYGMDGEVYGSKTIAAHRWSKLSQAKAYDAIDKSEE